MALEQAADRSGVPGVAVAVVEGDEVVGTAAFGAADLTAGTPMTPERAGNWFSMTKIATATSVMVLQERGLVDLDAPVVEYLGDRWPTGLATVRVRHLLQHSSGLRNPIPIRWVHRADQPAPDPDEFLARLLAKQRRPKVPPGTRAAYSNVGYLALGAVISAASGTEYVAFVRRELLEPLGMEHTDFHWTDAPVASAPRVTGYQPASRPMAWAVERFLPPGIIGARVGKLVALEPFELDGPPYGGLIGPVTDAARLVALHCNDGVVGGRRLLTKESVTAMTTIAVEGKPYDLGLGWFRPHGTPGPCVQHLGGGMGFWNILRIDPTTGRGAAVMSNTSRRWDIAGFADAAMAGASS